MKVIAKAYMCVGWYKETKPESRNDSNKSAGALFSDKDVAKEYAKKTMVDGYKIHIVSTYDYKKIDRLIKSGEWTPKKSDYSIISDTGGYIAMPIQNKKLKTRNTNESYLKTAIQLQHGLYKLQRKCKANRSQ